MKVLLIQPAKIDEQGITNEYLKHGRYKILKKRNSLRQISLPPLGLLYLGTPLKLAGHDVQIIDTPTLRLTNEEIVQEAIEYKPDLIGLSLYSNSLRVSYLLSQCLRRKLNVPILIGGPHANSMPDMTLKEFTGVDYVIRGWCDFSIVPFVEFLDHKRPIDEVPGLCYFANGSIVKNPTKDLPNNLDEVPIPDRSILKDMYAKGLYYNILSRRRNFDVLMTSRNCPFSCKFCYNLGGHKMLSHSPQRVVSEIRSIVNRGGNAIEIMDDTFTVDRKRTEKIFDLLEEEKFDLEFRIRSRVTLIDEKFLRRFKNIGGRAVSYGMESGSEHVLKLLNKGTTVAQNRKACEITKKAGIICHTTWLVGFPGETKENMQETFRFVKEIAPSTFNFGMLDPIPDTAVYNEARMNGTLVGEWGVHSISKPFAKNREWGSRDELRIALKKGVRSLYFDYRFLFQSFKLFLLTMNFRLLRYGLGLIYNKYW
jgi:anaerobic magnesium-protoporphyrin IX monomethyl ester cyclase